MDDHIIDVLTKGGVKYSRNPQRQGDALATTNHLLSVWESWLGLPEAPVEWGAAEDEDGDMTMEDAAPFPADFYRAVEKFLIAVWDPKGGTQKFSDVTSELSRFEDPMSVSLYQAVLSIRVTRFLRYWMDLNVMGGEVMDVVGSDDNGDRTDPTKQTTLSFQLLKNCSVDVTPIANSNSTHKVFPIIQSIYHHVESLPFLQSHIYLYTQSLSRGGSAAVNRTGKGLDNPQARLAHLQMVQIVSDKLQQEFDNHVRDLEFILGEWYAVGSVDIRKQTRAQLGSVWSHFEARSTGMGGGGSGAGMKMENTSSSGIAMTLRVLHRILLGIRRTGPLQKSHEHLLFHHLIPLHRPNSMVLWRDQASLLDLYHEPLVQCIAILLQKKPAWTGRVIAGLLEPDVWSKGANTPKLVLLLHEIDTYIGCLPLPISGTELGDNFAMVMRTLGSCMASENSRLAQRALPFVKNKIFVRLIELNFDTSLNILLPFLLRNEPSWNPTVRKMTYNVLKILQDYDEEKFVRIGNRCFDTASELPSPHQDPKPPESSKRTLQTSTTEEASSAALPSDYTIKSAMGGWKPPPATSSLPAPGSRSRMPAPSSRLTGDGGRANPPLGVTGVAPWAMGGPKTMTTIPTKRKNNPPLGVTGVAPWAMNTKKALPKTSSPSEQSQNGVSGVLDGTMNPYNDSTTLETARKPISCRVLAYMEKIKPPEDEDGVSSWSQVQMAESPTLLPTLKFHDLVFGHDLGEGAFGSVRYARLIDRTTTRSHWPEYAVKVISTEKIKEMGYEASVQREIAVLRILSHPCIARLISSFRFREGVYLVLEYASRGDLHSLLKKNGSLDHDSTRFVMGEVTSALASIHDIGLVYADLKPENIVVTALGHVKLTDFGGSRPVTAGAKQMVAESAENLLAKLRDGDWKERETKKKAFDLDDQDTREDPKFEKYDPDGDDRIEGTTIYLPPEVVMGAFPSVAADSWALGCVLYQCLTGRPPIIEADEALTKNRIVSFDVKDSRTNDENSLFDGNHATNLEPAARDLIVHLLDRHANRRPSMNQVAEHAFFQEAGVDVFTLHQNPAYPLDVGEVKPQTDAQWSRRQLSSIWAPQPQAYDISLDFQASATRVMGSQAAGPIAEGEEAASFFSKSNLLTPLRPASQGASLPPRIKAAEVE